MLTKEQKSIKNRKEYQRRKARQSGLPPPDNIADSQEVEPPPEIKAESEPEIQYEEEEVTMEEMEYIRQLRRLKSESKKRKAGMLWDIL